MCPQPTESARLAARDYPTANRLPLMEQHWRNLLFLHWEYDPSLIQKTLPKGLSVDLFEGKAYIGIVPLWISKVNLKLLPVIPGLSNFFELNLRTYVYDEAGTPGVWFYSLDANHYLAVQAAKTFFHLPYRYAQINSFINVEEQIEFSCHPDQARVILNYRYRGEGPLKSAEAGSLEFFLLERYFLFASKGQNLALGRVHHTPYTFCQPNVSQWDDRLFELDGLIRPQRPPDHMLFSPGVDVEIFNLQNMKNKV
jgi:uncharacterized protein YqjF (DUF2071 family)